MTMAATPHATVPGPRSVETFNAESQFAAPGTQGVALFSKLALDRGEGAILWDRDGNRYIDLMAGICVASLGYGHPKYVKALQDQVARLHVGSFATAHRAELVKLIASITPGDCNRTQFYSSGAEAVEAALRLAKSHTKKTEVIAFWGGYHGKTGGVLPLLGSNFKHELGPLMPGCYLSPYASPSRNEFNASSPPELLQRAMHFLRRKIQLETTNNIAAIIVEPIQGTAGNVVPAPGFLRELRKLADEIGAVLIADEMITGFGRTGKLFGVQHDDIVPDIMTVGKAFGGGFPMSGVIASEKVAFSMPWANPSGSSSSYGGNPLAAAAALAAISITLEEDLPARAQRIGEKMLGVMRGWEGAIPIVRDVRGRGLMIGMDLVHPKTGKLLDRAVTREIFDALLARGVLSMAYSPEVRINPPLVIEEADALEALSIMEGVLRDASERLL
jgi:4-aminobutyrate aminotransferase / (S)-3-amino-2-methylpropionate transaminase / 5-aminovalerate transaminase